MSLVKYYKCDVCDKEASKTYLINFKRKRYTYMSGFYEGKTKNFDICQKCYAKIVSEIKKDDEE